MAIMHFSKWHGAGNDFILVDDRQGQLPEDAAGLAVRLCDRHLGIGSDGLILLRQPHQADTDYHMEFLNPDGSRSFCGNGSRCAYAFRSKQDGERGTARFTAIDGVHNARWAGKEVEVSMRDVQGVERVDDEAYLLDTGSPHLVVRVPDPARVDIVPEAHRYRYNARFATAGVNVNFVRWHAGRVEMRTYERGVEAETLSCGTGVTAAGLWAMAQGLATGVCEVQAPGGLLHVRATRHPDRFTQVLLQGPVQEVFQGTVHPAA